MAVEYDKNDLQTQFEGIRDERGLQANTAYRIGSAFLSLLHFASDVTHTTIEELLKQIEGKYLAKDKDDTAHGTITFEMVQKFLQGLNVGEDKGTWFADGTLKLFRLLTNNFDSGPYGHGAQIDEKGNLEVNSIYSRQFISAPKFVFNEISVTKAEQWNTNGYGTIESVDVKNRIITLHLEDNDYGSLQVGDICRGLYADIDNAHGADKIEEGALDDCKFVQHKGFFTTYFYVSHIVTNEKGKFVFKYGKKNSNTPDPCAYMEFAQYGSFSDDKRQSSMYFSSRGNSYIEVLDGVCTWEIQSQNRVARYGWLGGLVLTKKDGSVVRPEGNGIYVQDNIYFGGNINYLQGLSGLDDLREEAKAYDVSLSQYQSVITVDDMGNVINGLYTEDDDKTTKQYRISTAVFARKGTDILLEEDDNSEDVTAGHYRVYAISEDCDVIVQNSTIFVTSIRNIKDGVAGTKDDANFDYDAMRRATDAMITIVVDLEGKITKTVQMPIRIQHDSLPFMVCDLSNENASLSWNTKTSKYVGLPIKTKVSLMYHNEPWTISSLNISKVAGLKTSMSIDGKAKVITVDADNLTADTLSQVTKMNITVVGKYAGANYEYTRELTILKSSDTVVYELIPSADSIVVDKEGNKTVNSVSCEVYATSSDDKRYKLTALPDGIILKYGKGENATTAVDLGASVTVAAGDKMVTFALYDKNNQVLDKESVPVLAYGKDGKGIEYIFKRTADDSSPANPTPDDFASNAEYQRTDKEYIPAGWTDDPTGVDAINLYEWVSKRVSINGHWDAFSDPAEYAHFGKHAAKATSTDDIVTIPADSKGNALVEFKEDVHFSLRVDGRNCTISSVIRDRAATTGVSYSISGNTVSISCTKGENLGSVAQTIVFKVTGTLDGSSYIDYVTVKIVPNVNGSDGDGYEYIYYRSNYLNGNFTEPPKRINGNLPKGWHEDPMPPTKDMRYVFVAYKQGTPGTDGEFSMPQLFNRYPKSILSQVTKFLAWNSLTEAPSADKIWNDGSTVMPTDFNDGNPWLWKVVKTTYTEGDPVYTVSCEGYKGKDGKDGNGIVPSYQRALSIPANKPEKINFVTYKNSLYLGNGWLSYMPAPADSPSQYEGISGPVLFNQNLDGDTWQRGITDVGYTWCRTPDVSGSGSHKMQIRFTTKENNQKVKFYLKANTFLYNYIILSQLDRTDVDGNNVVTYSAKASGDGEEKSVELTCSSAGEHFVTVLYDKDYDRQSEDYGLVRMETKGTYIAASTDGNLDGDLIADKAVVCGDYLLVKSGSILGSVSYNQNPNGSRWSEVSDEGYTWYRSPENIGANGMTTMQIRFTTTEDNQFVTFYLKAYSEADYDFILLSEIDSTVISRSSNYSFRASGDGKKIHAKLKCGKAGEHFITVAYAKDSTGDKFGDYGLVRMDTSDNFSWKKQTLYRCDGDYDGDEMINWGNIYQPQGDKGDKGDPGVPGGRGTRGPIPRTHKGAESGSYTYLQGADNEAYVDLVYDKDSATWYRCIQTHTTSSPDLTIVTQWEPSQTKGWTFLATELLLAENARIEMLGSQEINLLSDKSTIFGSFRHVKGDDEYAFWLGGPSGKDATTSITKGGKLKTTNAVITGEINATSGNVGGFKLKENNLVCENASLTIGYSNDSSTRKVVLDAKNYNFGDYNFALSVENHGISTKLDGRNWAGIHINVYSSTTSVQYPGIMMESGAFYGFRVPIISLWSYTDLRNDLSYISGMCLICKNSTDITITLPTSEKAKKGDVFTVIRAGSGNVTIKAPTGVNYQPIHGDNGTFTSTLRNEHIHFIFNGSTWYSECSGD